MSEIDFFPLLDRYINNPDVLIASFAGGGIFLISQENKKFLEKLFLFIPSFLSGIISAHFVSDIITFFTPREIVSYESLGALVASSLCVQILSIFANNIPNILKNIIARFTHGRL
ncbi:putative holin [Klebsiella aerogenes]|uniref:putative holin n=1 Tax=Klebsiella aerogenes TaxID=548 RepID=UPI00093138E3|nr:putative holin [Klebsiella aerogenes]